MHSGNFGILDFLKKKKKIPSITYFDVLSLSLAVVNSIVLKLSGPNEKKKSISFALVLQLRKPDQVV